MYNHNHSKQKAHLNFFALPSITSFLFFLVVIFFLVDPIGNFISSLAGLTGTSNPVLFVVIFFMPTFLIALYDFLRTPDTLIRKYNMDNLSGHASYLYKQIQETMMLPSLRHSLHLLWTANDKVPRHVFGTWRRQYLVIPQSTCEEYKNKPEQLLAIVAHEIAHIDHGDHWKATFAFKLGKWYLVITGGFWLAVNLFLPSLPQLLGSAFFVIGFCILYLVIANLFRLREFYADRYAAISLGSGRHFLEIFTSISALDQYGRKSLKDNTIEKAPHVYLRFLYKKQKMLLSQPLNFIVEYLQISKFWKEELFLSHPSIVNRMTAINSSDWRFIKTHIFSLACLSGFLITFNLRWENIIPKGQTLILLWPPIGVFIILYLLAYTINIRPRMLLTSMIQISIDLDLGAAAALATVLPWSFIWRTDIDLLGVAERLVHRSFLEIVPELNFFADLVFLLSITLPIMLVTASIIAILVRNFLVNCYSAKFLNNHTTFTFIFLPWLITAPVTFLFSGLLTIPFLSLAQVLLDNISTLAIASVAYLSIIGGFAFWLIQHYKRCPHCSNHIAQPYQLELRCPHCNKLVNERFVVYY